MIEVKNGRLCCPVCGRPTKTHVTDQTVMVHFPLWCQWCRRETIISYPKE